MPQSNVGMTVPDPRRRRIRSKQSIGLVPQLPNSSHGRAFLTDNIRLIGRREFHRGTYPKGVGCVWQDKNKEPGHVRIRTIWGMLSTRVVRGFIALMRAMNRNLSADHLLESAMLVCTDSSVR